MVDKDGEALIREWIREDAEVIAPDPCEPKERALFRPRFGLASRSYNFRMLLTRLRSSASA